MSVDGVRCAHDGDGDRVEDVDRVRLSVVAKVESLQGLLGGDQIQQVKRINSDALQREQKAKEALHPNFAGIAVNGARVRVEQRRHAAKELQHERLPVHDVELLDGELDRPRYQRIALVVGVDAQDGRYNQGIPKTFFVIRRRRNSYMSSLSLLGSRKKEKKLLKFPFSCAYPFKANTLRN